MGKLLFYLYIRRKYNPQLFIITIPIFFFFIKRSEILFFLHLNYNILDNLVFIKILFFKI